MTKRYPSSPAHRQGGGFLLESLIALVLMAVIGLGAVSVTSRAQVAQAQAFSRQHVINQMRLALLNNKYNGVNICDTAIFATLPDGSAKEITVHNCDLVTAKVNGVDVPNVRLPLSLTVDIPDGDQEFTLQVGGVLGQ